MNKRIEYFPSELRNINTFIYSPLTKTTTSMLLSFSISPRVPATKRAPAIVKLEFDPTKIVIDKD